MLLLEECTRQGISLLDAIQQTSYMRARDRQELVGKKPERQPGLAPPDEAALAALGIWNEM